MFHIGKIPVPFVSRRRKTKNIRQLFQGKSYCWLDVSTFDNRAPRHLSFWPLQLLVGGIYLEKEESLPFLWSKKVQWCCKCICALSWCIQNVAGRNFCWLIEFRTVSGWQKWFWSLEAQVTQVQTEKTSTGKHTHCTSASKGNDHTFHGIFFKKENQIFKKEVWLRHDMAGFLKFLCQWEIWLVREKVNTEMEWETVPESRAVPGMRVAEDHLSSRIPILCSAYTAGMVRSPHWIFILGPRQAVCFRTCSAFPWCIVRKQPWCCDTCLSWSGGLSRPLFLGKKRLFTFFAPNQRFGWRTIRPLDQVQDTKHSFHSCAQRSAEQEAMEGFCLLCAFDAVTQLVIRCLTFFKLWVRSRVFFRSQVLRIGSPVLGTFDADPGFRSQGPVSHEISELGNIGIIPIFPREILELLFNRKKKILVTIFNVFFIKNFFTEICMCCSIIGRKYLLQDIE